MNQKGYYRYPCVNGSTVVFVSEDDLWQVPISGGRAIRLTNVLSDVLNPLISEDGKWIAYTGRDEGNSEIYLMPFGGGVSERITFFGMSSFPVTWKKNKLIFRSNYGQAFPSVYELYEMDIESKEFKKLKFGEATQIAFNGNVTLIGRNIGDPAKWKRYRGGTAGHLWIDRNGNGVFKRFLQHINGNIAGTMLIGTNAYFVSDHEGIANLYSSDLSGKRIQKLTEHKKYYVRNAHTDGKFIVYHAGGDLFRYDVNNNKSEIIEIDYRGGRKQLSRKFHNAINYLTDFSVSNDGSSLTINSRGKSFSFGNWNGAVVQHGSRAAVRYKCTNFLNDGKRIVTVSDESGEYKLEVYNLKNPQNAKRFEKIDIGIPGKMKINPQRDELILSNHRSELIWVDLKTGASKLVTKNIYKPIDDFDWSPDGNWIAYASSTSIRDSVIFLYDLQNEKSHQVTNKVLSDYNPVFDPEGNYLYFISTRVFDPVYDTTHFDLGFPMSFRLYALVLSKDVNPPFLSKPKPILDEDKSVNPDHDKGSSGFKVDLEGITDRIVAFPLGDALYSNLVAAKGKLFYLVDTIKGSLNTSWASQNGGDVTTSLYSFDFEEGKQKQVFERVEDLTISGNKNALLVKMDKELRLLKCTKNAPEYTKERDGYSETNGWIDLSRVNLEINYPDEWRQMFKEAWRLQREYFWNQDMQNIDWINVFDNYYPLVDRLGSRGEFSDLIWEMQGELGTSHAYEIGGEYRMSPVYKHGFLGVDINYDNKTDSYTIENIVKGDAWSEKDTAPFMRPGTNISTGMKIVEVDGVRTDRKTHPFSRLTNLAGKEIDLKISDSGGKNFKTVNIKICSNETGIRYRDWVERNKNYVHRKSKNKVGYIHIPDMGARGYSEFHRYFLSELKYDGLVIDVRFNGGGHVSQLLLEKLARKRIGYGIPRWMEAEAYPVDSPAGPMVAITNEKAGSDGDIFSHVFKLMKLGKLIGKRTWGGVVGIWPRNWLVDGTITTQPEFSTWFVDVGFKIENYGVEPDIEIDIKPQDYADGKDPQLEKAIEIVLKEIIAKPGLKPVKISNKK
ncbi:peptidase [Ignavibacteria bacterium CHB1]|nr:MAG: peptidase [Chlorobiota bacterium]MBV6397799.1 Tricorn protease [Ignavibacteria bacterium]MCC6885576.1 PDZ domain-containing protein [Ignavibacteriales bacterium]MCE7952930.1 peptidase [Chlorobi bacterium CHB7]MDL1886907.1 peptidase [Ignavibacteria bacterium CHB1]RIK49685.1 MAG: peptidase [Ignavibacteriota bacterium]